MNLTLFQYAKVVAMPFLTIDLLHIDTSTKDDKAFGIKASQWKFFERSNRQETCQSLIPVKSHF